MTAQTAAFSKAPGGRSATPVELPVEEKHEGAEDYRDREDDEAPRVVVVAEEGGAEARVGRHDMEEDLPDLRRRRRPSRRAAIPHSGSGAGHGGWSGPVRPQR